MNFLASESRAIRLMGTLALGLSVMTVLACQRSAVDTKYRRVRDAGQWVMLTDGPWLPEFRDGRTLFLRPGAGMYFRGAREPVRWGYGDGWDWEAYSLGKDEGGTEVWFWSNTRMEGSRKGQTPVGTDWGITVVEHGDAGGTSTLERAVPEFDLPPRAARDKSSDSAFIRVVSQARPGKPYWDDAVIVWTRRGRAVQQAEKPFRAAHVLRDPTTGEILVARREISLGEVIGNPEWETGRRIRF
jgi:hypothetical protein